jgi:very-short-patch-repair endonuclease
MPGKRDHSERLLNFARQMRREPTDAEKKLWSLLRRGQINGLRFRRQVPIAGYIVDFCCLPAHVGVEADGGQHSDERTQEYDRRRAEALAAKGFRILRFSDYEILKHPEAVQETICRAVAD